MGWTSNDLRIEMMNAEAAEAAVEAIKNYATANASKYNSLNMANLMNDLDVDGMAIVLEDSYSMHCAEYLEFIPEICKLIAEIGTFSGSAFMTSGYGDEGDFEFSCDGDTIRLKSVYYPNGFCEYLCCEECGEDVVLFEEYEEGKIYICPDCGEEIDLSEAYEEHKPEINEIVIKIK